MNVVENDIRALVDKELASANERFPQFHSQHEGYAVILEEVNEMWEETQCIWRLIGELWESIRADKPASTEELKQAAIRAACEAVQVAAMAEKMEGVGAK